MKVRIEVSEKDLREMVLNRIRHASGVTSLDVDRVSIETKSKQNYRAEWETAAFRAVYEGDQ